MPPIIDGNKVINTPIKDILEMLVQQIYASRIDKLNTVDFKYNNARVTCPIHKDGHERTPSCDILLYDKQTVDFHGNKHTVPAGTVNCFACGYKANIVKFIADCLNISYRAATEWLLNFVDYTYLSDVRDIGDISFDSVDNNNYASLPPITIDELRTYDYIHPYMFERKLTDTIIDKFEIGYDKKTDSLTFPVYVNGRCLFVAKRRTKFKRFDMPEINPKPIYGLDYVTGNEVIVCESIINALTCWSYGKEAIALFGTGSSDQIAMLNNSNIRKFILALDGDEAGAIGTKRLLKGLTNKLVTVLDVPKGKDINDLTKLEFDQLDEIF